MYEETEFNLLQEADKFKIKFKYYKANKPKPSLHEVLSVNSDNDKVTQLKINTVDDVRTGFLGLLNPSEWKMYSFRDHAGLLLIRNPFTSIGQRYWIRKCLEHYPLKPNKLNIDIDSQIENWWASCHDSGNCNKELQKKLRWTTLGYHHNWDTKVYSEDNKTKFPEDLAELTDVVASCLGFRSFRPQAAIVNYYHINSTLSPHTDHSEVNLDAPLFSVSFGQSAIFLIGGRSKSIEPSAIQLESGDIIVMSKEARLCYHAVPKILHSSFSPWNEKVETVRVSESTNFKYIKDQINFINDINRNLKDSEWAAFDSYASECRINMNVRQVLNESQMCLNTNFNMH